jgi:hypothetical protein
LVEPTISALVALQGSDFALSASADDCSINIWSTKAGLTRISALSLKLQSCMDPQDNLNRAELFFLNYEEMELDNGAKIYLKKKQVPISDEKKMGLFEQETEKDLGDGEIMQAMLDDSAAIAEACVDDESSSVGILPDF